MTDGSLHGIALREPRRVSDLGLEFGGDVDSGCRDAIVRRIVAPERAGRDDDLVLVTSARRLPALKSGAPVTLVAADLAARVPEGRRWVHRHATWVVARLLEGMGKEDVVGIDRSARVEAGAIVHPTAVVRAGAVVKSGAVVGEHAVVGENSVIYGGVRVGARAQVGPLAVLGRPGFGFVEGPDGEVVRMPQLGGVVIGDDAEIGALVTVDAGTLGPTVVGRGAKLDAHVHVAHNVDIGEGVLVAAQAGFAGSSRIGARALIGGQAGVKDHAVVGEGARIGAKSGVIGDVAPADVVAGFPAVPRARWLRAWATILKQKKRFR